MAQRRMISQKIINTARFLKMPSDSQCLYFHLCLNADDDGVVEAYPIMRQTGSTEDNLRILEAKGFIKVLNEDLITFILDWNEHNKIRADRKVNSIYKDLIIQIVQGAELIEPKPRSDREYRDMGPSRDGHGTGMGRHRLGKVRLGKDKNNIINNITDACASDPAKDAKKNNKKLDYTVISDLITKLKSAVDIPILDGAEATNRRYAYLIINKLTNKDEALESGIQRTNALIDKISNDQFHKRNSTSFKYIFNHMMQIMNTKEAIK